MALHGVSIALACRTFEVSETCYRYSAKLNDENEQIADLLIGLARAKKTWGFGLCFLYLRNVRGHRWNHIRINPRLAAGLDIDPHIQKSRMSEISRSASAAPDGVSLPLTFVW